MEDNDIEVVSLLDPINSTNLSVSEVVMKSGFPTLDLTFEYLMMRHMQN